MSKLTPKENLQLIFAHQQPEYMPLKEDFDMGYPHGLDFINERPEINGVYNDWFGQSWTFEPAIGSGNPTPGVHLLTDITTWEDKIKFPDIDKLDWETYASRDTAKWDRNHKMSSLRNVFGMFERLFSVMDFTEVLIALMEEPEACSAFFGAVADHKIRLFERMIASYKPDIVIMHDDYGSHKDLFMPPDVWRALLKPHLKRIIESVRAQGVIYQHHNCGYWASIGEDLIEIGVSATDPTHPCNNLHKIKTQYGKRMVFFGGFNSQLLDLPDLKEEDARAHVRKVFSILAPSGGWVPTSGAFYGPNVDVINDEIKRCANEYYGTRPKI